MYVDSPKLFTISINKLIEQGYLIHAQYFKHFIYTYNNYSQKTKFKINKPFVVIPEISNPWGKYNKTCARTVK